MRWFYLLVFFNPDTILGKFFILLTGEQLAFTFQGLVLASIIYSLPFWIQPLQNSIEKVDKRLIQACTNMGSSKSFTEKKVSNRIERNIVEGLRYSLRNYYSYES